MARRGLLLLGLVVGLLALDGARPIASQQPAPEAVARAFLEQRDQQAAADASLQRSAAPQIATATANDRELEHVLTQESAGAYHVRFQETEDGVPIFGAHVTVNLDKRSGEVGMFTDRRRGDEAVSRSGVSFGLNEARAVALSSVGVSATRGSIGETQVYYPAGKQLVLAWQFEIPAVEPLGDWLVVVRADTGEVVLQQNVAPLDTGRVFDPNPAVTGAPPPPTNCDSTPNQSALTSEYRTRTLLGIDSGQDRLKGQSVDLTAPGILGAELVGGLAAGQANETSRNYIYGCNDPRFEEVMVYYHVDTTQRHIQSLGFTGTSAILAGPVPAHAHYMADCNAFYSTFDKGLHFGDCVTGGGSFVTDTAEDADVIVHEYGHAIQDDQVPGWGYGGPLVVEQAWAMGEGFGDFLASAVSGDPCVGEWVNFGFSTCAGSPGLRYLQNSRTYPAGYESCPDTPLGTEEEHCGGEIWGGALWDLVEALGNDSDARDLALRLALDSHFYLDPQPTFSDGVCAILAADADLYNGVHQTFITSVFAGRGITCLGSTPSDFPYAFWRIRHTWRGDLVVHIKAGVDPASPVCDFLIHNRDAAPSDSTDDVIAWIDLSGACSQSLPPSASTPWWLEVQDFGASDVGTISDFEIALSGTLRCVAADVPIAIPDATGASPGVIVRSKIDCSDVSEELPSSAMVWYFAEGFTGNGWETYTYLLNDGLSTANVQVEYLLVGGGTVTKNVVLQQQTRTSLLANNPAQGPGPNIAFGMRVSSDQPITAQQSLIDTAGNLAHGTVGSRTLSDIWYFAEGFTGNGWLTFISATNPNSVPVDVTAIYHKTDGTSVSVYKTIPANGRDTFIGHQDVPGSAFSVEVSSTLPIVSQEVLIDTVGLLAHGTIGSTVLANQWQLAEGFTGDSWLTFVSVGNLNDQPVTVTATYNLFGAPPVTSQLVIPAGARDTFAAHEMASGVGPGQSFGVTVSSTLPVVVQEVLIDPKPGVALAHGVLASTSLGTAFTFAGGSAEPNWLTFISVTNPGAQAGSATATYYFSSGPPVQRSQPISANSRITFASFDATGPGAALPFAVKVQASVPVVSQEVVIDVSPRFLAYSASGTLRETQVPNVAAVEWVWSGAVTTTSAKVNARLDADTDNVRLVVSESPALAQPIYSSFVSADGATNGDVASMSVSGLQPDAAYYYAIEVDGVIAGAEGRGQLHTFPQGAASFTIAFGSCALSGSNSAVFDAIRDFSPLLFLITGDFHYENISTNNEAAFRTAFNLQLGQTRQEDLYQSVPIAYVWDDHDYGGNDSNGNAASRTAARAAYRDFVPHYTLAAGSGNAAIYQAFTIGRVRFILSDLRSERNVGGSGSMMGAAQLAWFKSELAASATSHELVVWVSTVPWIATAAAGRDDWGGFAAERADIANFIATQGIDNLLMLAGDAHMIAIDDGSNSDYASTGDASFPVMHAAALDQTGSTKGGPYSKGTFPGGGQFGILTITDDGTNIQVDLSGRNTANQEIVSYSFSTP